MIYINGNKFSRFSHKIEGVQGYYKPLKNRIHFYDKNKVLFAALIHNKHNEFFFVNASRLDNGKTWYMYGIGEKQKQLLGLPDSYTKKAEIAQSIAEGFGKK